MSYRESIGLGVLVVAMFLTIVHQDPGAFTIASAGYFTIVLIFDTNVLEASYD